MILARVRTHTSVESIVCRAPENVCFASAIAIESRLLSLLIALWEAPLRSPDKIEKKKFFVVSYTRFQLL